MTVEMLEQQQALYLQRAKHIVDVAEKEGRALLPEEATTHAQCLAYVDKFDQRIKDARVDAATREAATAIAGNGQRSKAGSSAKGSWGDQFVAATKDFFASGFHRSQAAWSSPAIQVPWQATTLGEGAGSGAALVQPDVQPGPIPMPTRPLRIAELFATGATSSNTVRLMMETTFTNNAAPVAEGTAKPESALAFTAVDEPVRKIAHFLPVTDEMLEDVPTIRSYIDSRLRLGVLLTEDDQLLNGSGTAPALLGILNRSGLTATVTQTTEAIADLIAKQIQAIATASMLLPDAVIMNGADWLTLLTVKTTAGEYLADNAPFVSMNPPMIWGLPVIVTPAIVAKTILIGNFALGGIVFRHTSGLSIAATSSHQDWFTKNLTCVRAEERIALAIVRASAFGKVVLA